MHVSYYQSLDIVLIHMIQFQHLNLTIKKKLKNHIRIFEGTLSNFKKWWEPQYLANPPNLILSGVTHSLTNFLIFLILFPTFSEWHHIYTQIDKAGQHKDSPVFGLCDNFLHLNTY